MDKFVEILVYFDIFRVIVSIKAIVTKLHLCKLIFSWRGQMMTVTVLATGR
jgi:hypothetical protein